MARSCGSFRSIVSLHWRWRVSTTPSSPSHRPFGLSAAVLFTGYAIVSLVPLLLAAIQGNPLRNVTRELSGGLIMVAYVMTLLQFVMSGRFETLTGRAGIDRTMRFHTLVAWYIMAAFIVHPLLYSVPGLTFAVPPMGPPLFGRVRSMAGGEPGPWGPVYDLTERPTEPSSP